MSDINLNSDAYNTGYQAYIDEKPRKDNPYATGTWEAINWDAGYNDAKYNNAD